MSNGTTASIWCNKHCVSLSFLSNTSEMRSNVIWRVVALVWVMESNDWDGVFVHWIIVVAIYCELKHLLIFIEKRLSDKVSILYGILYALLCIENWWNNISWTTFAVRKRSRSHIYLWYFWELFWDFCSVIGLVLILDHYWMNGPIWFIVWWILHYQICGHFIVLICFIGFGRG